MRKLTMMLKAILSVGILLLQVISPILATLSPDGDLSTFSALKYTHKLKTCRTEQLKSVVKRADYARFEAYLRPMMIPRVPDTEGNRIVQKHITESLEALGWSLELDRFNDQTPHGTKEFTNIVATQNPSAPRKLTLACHFDSKYFPPGERFIGMTDSAVPCAMLLDLAASLNDLLNGTNLNKVDDVTLQLMFFDGEEAFIAWTGNDHTYGSRHLAAKMSNREVMVDTVTVREIDTMDVLVLLRVIGAPNRRFMNWYDSTGPLYEKLRQIEVRLLRAKLMEEQSGYKNVYFGSAKGRGATIQDDHVPFLQRDVRVLHLISYPFPGVWHKTSDDEKAMSAPDIVNVNNIMRVFLTEYLHLV